MNGKTKWETRKIVSMSSVIEMAERYVFYTIQSLLIFYLISQLHLSHAVSAQLAGTVFGMVYLSAWVGGFIADRLLGYYVTIMVGTVILIAGSAMMFSVHSENSLFIGLSLISMSSGLIKSNVSSFIGKYYDHIAARESERDFGFNVFYVIMNLGVIFATFFAITLRNKYGFDATFYISCAVAILSCMIAVSGFFVMKKHTVDNKITAQSILKTIAIIVGYVGLVFYLLKSAHVANAMFIMAAAICVVTLLISGRNNQMPRVMIALPFFGLSVLYWTLYMQLFISLLLFIHDCVSHYFLGFSINTSQFISFESFFVLLLGIFVGKIWVYFENKQNAIHDIDKFGIAFALIGLMFGLLYVAISFSSPAEKISGGIVIAGVFLMAVSELSLSAIGLSMVTKIAPSGYVSLYMGIWLVTLGIGSKLAGQFASQIDISHHVLQSKIAMAHGLIWLFIFSGLGFVIAMLVRKKVIAHVRNHVSLVH